MSARAGAGLRPAEHARNDHTDLPCESNCSDSMFRYLLCQVSACSGEALRQGPSNNESPGSLFHKQRYQSRTLCNSMWGKWVALAAA